MARKSLDLKELTSVDPQSIISTLAQENAELRLQLLIKQSVIERMIAAVTESGGDSGEDLSEELDTSFK